MHSDYDRGIPSEMLNLGRIIGIGHRLKFGIEKLGSGFFDFFHQQTGLFLTHVLRLFLPTKRIAYTNKKRLF
jgi:hypothetical protein